MKKTPRNPQQAGFALVVTLSLMILLTIIAVAFLGLSSVSLRSSSQAASASIARNNARLGMMMALNELQRTLGPDRAVSASAAAVVNNPNQPHILGAWTSEPRNQSGTADWRWTPTRGGAPDYGSKSQKFDRWLVSTANPEDAEDPGFPGANAPSGNGSIALVGDRSLGAGSVSTLVRAEKVPIVKSGRSDGKYAWSVSDENAKAAIQLSDPAITPSAGEEIASRGVPTRVRADILSAALAPALEKPENLISLETAVIPGGSGTKNEFAARFHDFTTSSVGLLTDTSRGGLKVDLTTIFEEGGNNDSPNTINDYFDSSSPYSDSPTDTTFNAPNFGPARWTYFRDTYRKYKNLQSNGGELRYTLTDKDLERTGTGVLNVPDTHRLLPVIAKVQMAFSLASHVEHLGNRPSFYNNYGVNPHNPVQKATNADFHVIHLVTDPVVTLYNPYDVALELRHLRVRIWDPPIGFKFKKVLSNTGQEFDFRSTTENQGFLPLARYQAANQNNANARKTFTLLLTDGTDTGPGNSLKLMPGEVKVFSPRVEPDWSWTYETDHRRNFFDHNFADNSGNKDRRGGANANFGVQTVPGWTSKAGFSLDHLSLDGSRPDNTKYEFERTQPGFPNGSFVATYKEDGVRVEAKPMKANGSASTTFQIDIMAGVEEGVIDPGSTQSDSQNQNVIRDVLRSYKFTLGNPAEELIGNVATVDRLFLAKDLLQANGDTGIGGKKTFAMLEVSARTTKDDLTDNKPWLYNNPVVEGADQLTNRVGLSNQSYDIRFKEMTSFNDFPGGIEVDPQTDRGYFGASSFKSEDGSSFVNMIHVPSAPAASLGDFVHSNLLGGAPLPRVLHALGNGNQHPLINAGAVSQSLSGNQIFDHSYLLNDALWDKYYFSSLTNYGSVLLGNRSRESVIEGVISGNTPALNQRLVTLVGASSSGELAKELDDMDARELSRKLSKYVGVSGAFNLNSTSVDAWRAVLASTRDRVINGGNIGTSNIADRTFDNDNETPFVRWNKPVAAAGESSGMRWAGYRALTDDQITDLAEAIVEEIKARGVEDQAPAFSVGEFVNRRPGSPVSSGSPNHEQKGLLQVAIDRTNINDIATQSNRDGKQISGASVSTLRKRGANNTDAMTGSTAEGTPAFLTQGDLMAALGGIATVRGDTFKIRSYGEATDAAGTTILARAWCEVIVQRVPDYVDPGDLPETPTADLNNVNEIFGRRFNIVSFRWLNENEVMN